MSAGVLLQILRVLELRQLFHKQGREKLRVSSELVHKHALGICMIGLPRAADTMVEYTISESLPRRACRFRSQSLEEH